MKQSLDLIVNLLSARDKVPELMEDIRKPALPIFITNWVLGLSIIEYPLGTQHRIISFLYVAAIQVGYCSVAFNGYPSLVSMAKEFKINLRFMQILFFSQIVLCICSSILGWFRTKGMQEILQRIAVADYMLELIGISKDYVQVLKSQIRQVAGFSLFILTFVTINAINMLATDITNSGKIMVIFTISYPTIIVFIVDSTFISTIQYIRLKFKKLNKLLRQMCTTTFNNPRHTRVARAFSKVYRNKINSGEECIVADNTYTIHTAKKAHIELVKICQVGDNIYGLHIIMSLTAAIGIVTGSLYYLYGLLRYTTVSNRELTRLLSFTGIWIIYSILKVLTYCICCSAVSDESRKTGEIISEFYDEPVMNEEAKSEIRDFHVQLIQNSSEFTANGFINVNIALIQTITGSIITYLMILIQLGSISSPSDPA